MIVEPVIARCTLSVEGEDETEESFGKTILGLAGESVLAFGPIRWI